MFLLSSLTLCLGLDSQLLILFSERLYFYINIKLFFSFSFLSCMSDCSELFVDDDYLTFYRKDLLIINLEYYKTCIRKYTMEREPNPSYYKLIKHKYMQQIFKRYIIKFS